jgi:F0F1-type ATP synthase epsilon subunit
MLKCTILSPTETQTYTDIRSVTLPAVSGQMQVLTGHAESFVALKKGIIRIQRENEKGKALDITSGECYVRANQILIFL